MGWEVWFTITVLATVFAFLAFTDFGTDTVLFGGLTLLLVSGIIGPVDAFRGFANEGVVTVGVLFIVAGALRESGATWVLINQLLGQCRSIVSAQARIVFPVAAMSGFWNNTPLVAVLLPAIADWARKYNLSISKLLIPLSYAAMLGGMCTLMGTSTNLIVNGLLKEIGHEGMHFFEIGMVGLPCAVAGCCYLLVVGRKLLPDRSLALTMHEDPRQYLLEMIVQPGSALVGKTLREAGLVDLHGTYLMEIERRGRVIDEPQPEDVIEEGDCLYFVGVIHSAVELQKTPGLLPATDERFKLSSGPYHRTLVEAVVSDSSPMLGQTISEGRFRTRYDAVVIGVARNGERVDKRLGDIVLRAGDTLLLEALPSFVDQHRNSRDFYLVSRVEGYTPPRHERAWIALAILAALVLSVVLGWLTLLEASLLASGACLAFRCISSEQSRRSVDWRLITTIAAAFGIGRALETSGAAAVISDQIVGAATGNPFLALILIYFVTLVFTELMTNAAAAMLVFPIAVTTSQELGVNLMPYIVTIMIAGSASFITPIGYQTNLMVYGPGGYRFSDFVKIGTPLALIVGFICVSLAPVFWPF